MRLRDAENLRLDCLPGWGSGAGGSLCGFYPRIIQKKKKKVLFLGNKTAGNCKDFVLEKGGCSSAVTKVLNSGCAWKWKSIGVPGGPWTLETVTLPKSAF